MFLLKRLCYSVGNNKDMLTIMNILGFDHCLRVDAEVLEQATT